MSFKAVPKRNHKKVKFDICLYGGNRNVHLMPLHVIFTLNIQKSKKKKTLNLNVM